MPAIPDGARKGEEIEMKTKLLTAAALAAGAVGAVVGFAVRLYVRRKVFNELSALSDCMLEDIGMTPSLNVAPSRCALPERRALRGLLHCHRHILAPHPRLVALGAVYIASASRGMPTEPIRQRMDEALDQLIARRPALARVRTVLPTFLQMEKLLDLVKLIITVGVTNSVEAAAFVSLVGNHTVETIKRIQKAVSLTNWQINFFDGGFV